MASSTTEDTQEVKQEVTHEDTLEGTLEETPQDNYKDFLPSQARCSYAWTCHECTNITTVDIRNTERYYNGNVCENERCLHKRCTTCISTKNNNSRCTIIKDHLPIRRGIKSYACTFRPLLSCNRHHKSWLSADKCARGHYAGVPFVPCTEPTCDRKFLSLDLFREHVVTHRGLVEAAAVAAFRATPLPVEYVVLPCPLHAINHCSKICTSLKDLQEHFQIHLAAVQDRPMVFEVRDCELRMDGLYACRYGTVFGCGVAFRVPMRERGHFMVHFPQLLPCPLCEMNFHLPEWVAEHLWTHMEADTGEAVHDEVGEGASSS